VVVIENYFPVDFHVLSLNPSPKLSRKINVQCNYASSLG